MEDDTKNQIQNANAFDVEPPIFKLFDDCIYHIFGLLSLRDLNAISQTCKKWHELSTSYFCLHYPLAEAKCMCDGIYIDGARMNGFIGYVRRIVVTLLFDYYGQISRQSVESTFNNVDRILFYNCHLDHKSIPWIEPILTKVEDICFYYSRFSLSVSDQVLVNILKRCKKLKRLGLRGFTFTRNYTSHNWLRQDHSSLEYFEWISPKRAVRRQCKIPELKLFLQRHPNIRRIHIDVHLLWQNADLIEAVHLDLDDLAINFYYENGSMLGEYFVICAFLNRLHQRGSCRRLHLYYPTVDQYSIQHISSLEALVSVHRKNIISPINLSTLVNVNQLVFGENQDKSVEPLAKEISSLERVHFENTRSDNILPFICHSPKLKQIKIDELMRGKHFQGNVLDLGALNCLRTMLAGAVKVTIVIDRNVFFATKRALGKTNLPLIEMKSIDSVEWDPFESMMSYYVH